MRTSDDVYKGGRLIHGFDYVKQAWVKDGKYLRCGHPDSTDGRPIKCGCYGRAHEGEETKAKQRMVFTALHTQFDENGFIPSVVFEGEKGHHPIMMGQGSCAVPWYWGKTYDECQALCDERNERAGISKLEAAKIVCASF
jgi:hypothetical protein